MRAEIWLTLRYILERMLVAQSRRFLGLPFEDLQDIASQKALVLLQRIESNQWTLQDRSSGEIVNFLVRTAHHGLIDAQSRRRRSVPLADDRAMEEAMGAWPPALVASEAPDHRVQRREFAESLRLCLEQLSPRARRIWFFRVFFNMPSKRIARHPEVAIDSRYVDVILQRCRQTIRDCMRKRGFDPEAVSPQDLGGLWALLYPCASAAGEEEGE